MPRPSPGGGAALRPASDISSANPRPFFRGPAGRPPPTFLTAARHVNRSKAMIDRRDTRVSRAANGMTKSAGLGALLVASALAGGGCSLLPFTGGGSTPRHALRPEIHEVSANPQPD